MVRFRWQRRLLVYAMLFAPQAAPQNQPAEVATKETPATFKSRVNLVPVTVVVRDREGHAVGNLAKDDFRLLDNGKPQVISRFSVEKPSAPVVIAKDAADLEEHAASRPPATVAPAAPAAPVAAEHFVAYVFDDVHGTAEDLFRARDAAANVMAGSMQPADRAALYTTSGQNVVEFTNDLETLRAALARLRPTPITGGLPHGVQCPDISFYLADRIVNLDDPQALTVALVNYQACSGNPYITASEVKAAAQMALTSGEHETHVAASVLGQVVRRLAGLPGQRNLVMATPGFFVASYDQSEITDLINRAVRASVIISTLDIRGLWTPPGYDASRPTPAGGGQVITMLNQYLELEAIAQEDVLENLAHSTGGEWFHANNDLGSGFRRLAAAPAFVYVLAFTPENLKSDGKYHKLQVSLRDGKGLTVQARKGYYAPRRDADLADQARQDIEDAVFSRSVVKDIPLELHTQFFRTEGDDANLSVVAQLDIRALPYRKAEGRNQDSLTIVSALFDLNGNFVAGTQKILELRLKDDTLQTRLDSGIKIKTSFDVKVGTYAVRVVARDSEGQIMASDNILVEIQ
ncbi:MAG TPA: VWA domain-containing protein [Bryobacteraceae bacterium]|nr:VWA domain-containing protein [Bryobacteraceae bacterium]